ncbi:MAG: glucosamine-6-phosphate deaminase [Phycisphaerales bacterium]|nr:MAG: glucosamine-6-phosphate deaminase [Phycisphaerales bacterium]
MEIIISETYDEMSRLAADMIKHQLLKKPSSVLGLATGSTPVGLYKELIRLHKEQGLDFSQVITFNLDEYLGLPPSHDQSYHYFMDQNLFHHVNVTPNNIHVPYGHTEDIEEFCQWYEDQIERAGGIDIQILGIGGDGHIAFNEPGSSLGSRTRLKTLTKQTIDDNARFFENEADVPRFAVTMGVGTILEARKIIMLANGAKKADIVAQALEGPVTAQVSASALQLHPDVVVILDAEAGKTLRRADYYKWVYNEKKRLIPGMIGKTT